MQKYVQKTKISHNYFWLCDTGSYSLFQINSILILTSAVFDVHHDGIYLYHIWEKWQPIGNPIY